MSAKWIYLISSIILCGFSFGRGNAWGQSISAGQVTPQHSTVDKNNVDLGTGQWAGEVAHISIGDPKNGGMEWSQPANGPDGLSAIMIYGPGGNRNVSNSGWTLNGNIAAFGNNGNGSFSDAEDCDTSGSISYLDIDDNGDDQCEPSPTQNTSILTAGMTVIYLGKSYHFWGDWDEYTGSGSSHNVGQMVNFFELLESGGSARFGCIVGDGPGVWEGCVFTAHDGTVVNFPAFSYMIAPNGESQIPYVAQATNLVKPDGETWTYYGSSSKIPGIGWAPTSSGSVTFGYVTGFSPGLATLVRPAAIVSNRGYTIKYLWNSTAVTEVVAYNTNQESCAPTASQCTFQNSWPAVHFSYTPFSNNAFTLDVTDALGSTTQYASSFTTSNNIYTYPVSTTITTPTGHVEGFTLDTKYLGLGAADDVFGGPGNISPPTAFNTQHVITYFSGSSTWDYTYNYKYIDLHLQAGHGGYYGNTGFMFELYYLNIQTTRKDPLGNTRTVTSLPDGAPLTDVDELGRTTTLTVEPPLEPTISDIAGSIDAIQNPNGDLIQFNYNGQNRNVTSTVFQKAPNNTVSTGNVSQLTTTYNYGITCQYNNGYSFIDCNEPTSVIDPNGNETDYTYSDAYGAVLTATAPADANGVRPQTRYTYQQFTAQGQTGAVWLLISTSTCMTATTANPASCVGTAQEVVKSYGYDSNNLLLISEKTAAGDGSVTATMLYGYDAVGNRVWVKGPRTDVDDTRYTTYDVLRRPVYEIGADPDGSGPLPRQIVHHLYDADGNEIRTEAGTGNATDGSDFSISSYKAMTYDPATGLLVKTVTATVP